MYYVVIQLTIIFESKEMGLYIHNAKFGHGVIMQKKEAPFMEPQ